MRDQCNVTGKDIYPTKEAARQAMRQFGHNRGSRKIYRCVFCDKYHMSKAERHGGLGGRKSK